MPMAEHVIGIDLGGTETKIGIVQEDGKIIEKRMIPTKVFEGRIAVVTRIGDAIEELLHESGMNSSDVIGIGVGSPGSIDHETGTVLFSPNLPDWSGFGLAAMLEKITGIKTFIENDANSFILGEWAFGEFKGSQHMLGLTLGTGVGGGVITHGMLMTGSMGYGGELGHTIVEPGGPLCGCGSHGCLESLASATAIVNMAREFSKRFPESLIFASPEITAKVVFDSARAGDLAATIVVERATRALAMAISNYIHVFNPEHIIIGGGISKAGDLLIDSIQKKMPEYVMPSFNGTFSITLSKLVENAGIKGAASIVFYRIS
jgi:glucokinase